MTPCAPTPRRSTRTDSFSPSRGIWNGKCGRTRRGNSLNQRSKPHCPKMISSPDCENNMPAPDVLALTPEQLAISPGAGAFAVFFVLAVAMVLLVMNMSKHLRKVDRYRIEEEVRAEFEAEQAREAEEAEEAEEGAEEPATQEPPTEEGHGEEQNHGSENSPGETRR